MWQRFVSVVVAAGSWRATLRWRPPGLDQITLKVQIDASSCCSCLLFSLGVFCLDWPRWLCPPLEPPRTGAVFPRVGGTGFGPLSEPPSLQPEPWPRSVQYNGPFNHEIFSSPIQRKHATCNVVVFYLEWFFSFAYDLFRRGKFVTWRGPCG